MIVRNTNEAVRAGPVHVALYMRVSTDKQAKKEDGSLDTQRDLLVKLVGAKCEAGNNWLVTEQLVEGEKDGKRHGKSAKNTNRPAYQKLLELVRSRLVDVVVINKIDRISRSVKDFLNLVEVLEQHGVKIVSRHEQIDLTTPAGRLQVVIMIALAQHEREVTSARVKEKVAWRVEKGFPIGPPPIGYRMEHKLYVIDESFAAHVRAADALYLERQSVDAVVVEFRNRGYRTPKGSFYTKPVLCRMLRSPIYVAKQQYEGQFYDGQWKPIRSLETHQVIQGMMDKNDRRKRSDKRQSRDYVYLLQGLLRCGLCGHAMSPRPGMGQSGEYYPYYQCGASEKSVGGECPRRYVPAETLDRAVLEFMKQLHLNPERIRVIAAGANEFTGETLTKLKQDLERVRAQLASVKSKLTLLVDALAQGSAAMATLREKIEALEAERAELEATEARLKSEMAAEQNEKIVADDQIRALAQFNEMVNENADNPEAIKALLPRFIDYVGFYAEEKGEGKLEVALFPDPVMSSSDVLWTGDPAGPRFAAESQMVGAAGFEPTASCSRSKRSSQTEPRPDERSSGGIIAVTEPPARAAPNHGRDLIPRGVHPLI